MQWVGILHAFSCVTKLALTATCLCILATDVAGHHGCALSLAFPLALLLLDVHALHLVMLINLVIHFFFLSIALLLHLHLLLLFEKKDLLNLLLSKLLVNHLLLSWEVILFDLLTTSFDIKLTFVLLIFIFFV